MARGDWFREAKYGMMIHWGLYSLLGGEWRGQRMDEIGERHIGDARLLQAVRAAMEAVQIAAERAFPK